MNQSSMLVRITGSQLLIFPLTNTFIYHGVVDETKNGKPIFKLLNIKVLECEKDLENFDYMGKMTADDEVTILVKPTHYEYLVNLHLSKQHPEKMYIKFNKENVTYYGLRC